MSKNGKATKSGPDLVPHFLSKDELIKKGHRFADVIRELNGLSKRKHSLSEERDQLANELHEKTELVEEPHLFPDPKKKPDIAEPTE